MTDLELSDEEFARGVAEARAFHEAERERESIQHVHEYSYAYMGCDMSRPAGDHITLVFFCKWCLHREVVSADPEKDRAKK